MTSPGNRVMFLTSLAGALLSCAMGNQGKQLFPPEFEKICKIQDNINGVTNIRCDITSTDEQQWRLDTLRNWATPSNIDQSEKFSYDLVCDNSGVSVSVPHPVKCPGLHALTIRHCNVTDVFADFGNLTIYTIPSTLTKFEIIDSTMAQKRSTLYNMFANIDKLTSDYECLQVETIQQIVYRNVFYYIEDDTDEFLMKCIEKYRSMNSLIDLGGGAGVGARVGAGSTTPNPLTDPSSNSSGNSVELNDICDYLNSEEVIDLPVKIRELDISCDYQRLRYLEDSSSSAMSVYDFRFLAKYNEFPVLEYYNSSNNNIDKVPEELEDWSFYFKVIKYIDLSHNRISTFSEFKSRFVQNLINDTYINLQFNNITNFVPADLDHLGNQDKQFLDLRNNPIICDCELKDFVEALDDADLFSGSLEKYKYIQDMECRYPEILEGRSLKSLTVDELGCDMNNWIEPFIALVIIAVILVTLIILSFIYRREIRILFYTRLNIQMPGVEYARLGPKKYHAFVSYSNEDSDWVLDIFCKQLEDPDQSTYSESSKKKKAHSHFKLCLHDRDFIPGMTIIENIINSVENSRHTVIVVTENFVQSKWAMEEFYQAYYQSVKERRKHLIIIIRGELPQNIDPKLKRCLKTFTYLKTSDKLFYDRLAYSLSTENRMSKEESSREKQNLDSDEKQKSCVVDMGQDNDSGIFNTTDDSMSSIGGQLNTQTSVISTTNSEVGLVEATRL